MSNLLDRIAEFESRPCTLSASELSLREKHMQNFITSNSFEGLHASDIDTKLYGLVVAKKVSTSEYLALCRQVASEIRA